MFRRAQGRPPGLRSDLTGANRVVLGLWPSGHPHSAATVDAVFELRGQKSFSERELGGCSRCLRQQWFHFYQVGRSRDSFTDLLARSRARIATAPRH